MSVTGSGATSISGFDTTLEWGSLTCRYTGAFSGAYNQVSGMMPFSGSVSRVSGSLLCPSSPAITGTVYFFGSSSVPVTL